MNKTAKHTLSSPDTAYHIVHKAYDKILTGLAVDEYIHIVELRRKKKTKTNIVYEYCADHNNDRGEIRYTPCNGDYEVIRYIYSDRKGGFFAMSGNPQKRSSRKRWLFRSQKYSYKTQKAPPGVKTSILIPSGALLYSSAHSVYDAVLSKMGMTILKPYFSGKIDRKMIRR